MFLGRSSELEYLNSYYEREGSQIMVVYGEKGVGKTSLLSNFMQGKPGFYYRARSASEREQRYQWGAELKREGIETAEYPDFTELLEASHSDKNKKTVILIDEFQYIIKASDEFIRELITFVHNQHSNRIMIILCSSSIGWVENSMIGRIGEAAYELSGLLKIRALDFDDFMGFFPGFSIEQCVEAYAVLGGIPGLWKRFDDKLSVKENICRHILNENSFLREEGKRIVREELRETGVYNTILASIATGKYKLNDLYLHTEFSRAKISVYLKNLMELELVEKIFSYDTEGKANAQKGIYRISNHFVHFYFTYLYPNLSSLQRMTEEEFYDKYIAPAFKNYVACYFREVCRQYMEKQNKLGSLPIEADRIGEWVGKQGTIDFVVQNEEGKTIIGICNWEKSVMGYDDYERLLFCAKEAMLPADYVYLFSARGFDEKIRREAGIKQNLKLISMEEM